MAKPAHKPPDSEAQPPTPTEPPNPVPLIQPPATNNQPPPDPFAPIIQTHHLTPAQIFRKIPLPNNRFAIITTDARCLYSDASDTTS